LSCPNGKRAKIVQKSDKFGPKHGHVFKAGIMAFGIEQRNYCSNELIKQENVMRSATKPKGIIDCDPFFDHEAIHEDLVKCKDMHKNDGICVVNLVNKQGEFQLFKSGVTVPKECSDDGMFFIQYGCELDAKKYERQVFGLYFACTAVFIYFYATVFIDYIKSVESTNQLDFDVKTLTAGDYSAEFSIAHTQYDSWKEKYFQDANPMSEMAQFKLYVQLEIEKRLTEMPNLGIDPDINEIKIA
jgi:hypothetical protein